MLAGLVLALAACDVGAPAPEDASRGFDRPEVRVTAAAATGSYDEDGRPVPVALAADQLIKEIETTSSIRLRFDRFLLPRKVLRQAICLQADLTTVQSIDDCTDPFQEFTEPAYDPVTREVVLRLPPGATLGVNKTYRLTVFRQEDIDQHGLFAFDGAPLAATVSFDFQTKATESTTREALPSPSAYCGIQTCFANCAGEQACRDGCAKRCLEGDCNGSHDGDLVAGPHLFDTCAFSSCHKAGVDDQGHPIFEAMGLSLAGPEAIEATAIDRTAHQTQTGQAAHAPRQSDARFGRAMPILDPLHPGNSYLLYKLLISPLNYPGQALDAHDAAEVARLRASFVVGLPMPAESSGPRPTFGLLDEEGSASYQKLKTLSAWIAHGAVTRCE